MVIAVAEEDFPQMLRAWGGSAAVVEPFGSGSRASSPVPGGWLCAESALSPLEFCQALTGDGVHATVGSVRSGWLDHRPEVWVSAVAYRSRESAPGLWVDASAHEPQREEVLEKFYFEMTADGSAGAISYERFMEMAQPNVVIARSGDLEQPESPQGPEPLSPHTSSLDSASSDAAN
jgi:hypothetical protein